MRSPKSELSFRVGTGFDLHPLVSGRPCWIGGVKLPFPKGPLGHSDGDALLHALADALLGAAGLDDLGTLFPDSDPAWKGASSAKLIQEVLRRVRESGYEIENVDAVLIAEQPRIGPHRAEIRASLARILEIPVERVNVKGKSAEKMGPIGAGEAIAASAVALLVAKLPEK